MSRHRLYGKSILELIRNCESLEELEMLGRIVRARGVYAEPRTERRWRAAVEAKEAELRARRIIVPSRRLMVPTGAGRLIVPGRLP